MEDLRKVEINEVNNVVQYLADTYPNLYEVSNYNHPVKGVQTQLLIKSHLQYIDICTIKGVTIDILGNQISIHTLNSIFVTKQFIKDSTVI